jgi:hypothetical protein
MLKAVVPEECGAAGGGTNEEVLWAEDPPPSNNIHHHSSSNTITISVHLFCNLAEKATSKRNSYLLYCLLHFLSINRFHNHH